MKENLIKIGFIQWINLLEIAPYPVMFWDIPKIVQNAYIQDFFIKSYEIMVIVERDLEYFSVKILDFKNGNKYNKICFDFNSYEEAFEYGLNHVSKKLTL